MKIKRRTRIAVQIEEKLSIRSRPSGNAAAGSDPSAGDSPDCLGILLERIQKKQQAAVSQIKTQEEERCNEESK